ncbi:MAG: hypothetical protein Q4A32_07585, partial [Lachnospiraceae bacterium]|nr:hypothetical protein [Lachnospiraceae bacterium]
RVVGVYLVMQSLAAEGYESIMPFLVTVPISGEDDEWIYDVDASPKLQLVPEETMPPEDVTVTETPPDISVPPEESPTGIPPGGGSATAAPPDTSVSPGASIPPGGGGGTSPDGDTSITPPPGGGNSTATPAQGRTTATPAGGRATATPASSRVTSTTSESRATVTPRMTTTPSSSLPKTGQLWWPVPVLAAIGLIFVFVGLKRRSDNK